MTRSIRFLVAVLALCGRSGAQELSARDAYRLVALAPPVVASKSRGECPYLALSVEEEHYSVQARMGCPPATLVGSGLIDNYKVDRRTAMVANGSGTVVTSPSMGRLRSEVLEAIKRQKIAAEEALCLAKTAAKSRFRLTDGAASSLTARLIGRGSWGSSSILVLHRTSF